MLGFIVGIFASIMGVGGAFLMVPAMIYIIGMPTKLVPGTSLFVTIFITAFVVIAHALQFQTIDFILVSILLWGPVEVMAKRFVVPELDLLQAGASKSNKLTIGVVVQLVCIICIFGLMSMPH